MEILRRIALWLRRPRHPSPFTVLEGHGGRKVIVDQATLEYLNSSAPQPTQAALDSLLDQVRTVRVFEDGCQGGTPLGTKVLLETTEPTDITELRSALRIVEGPGGHCMCFGGPTLEMSSAEQTRLALLGIHHGLAIRWNQWKDDARLTNGRLLLEWLADRGVVEPLRDFEDAEERDRQANDDRNRWLQAMPVGLRPIWEGALSEWGTVDVPPLRAALERDEPDEDKRILALLEWFGCGAGPWSGFPSYETAAEELLLGYSTARLMEAAESVQLSPAQKEGAARLFAGWSFGKQRPRDLTRIPSPLKTALWLHVKDTQDEDKRGRAKRALAE